jgi:hypothetical protein
MFNHHAGIDHPWTWAVIHGVAVLLASIGVLVFWKSTETQQQRAGALAIDLKTAELAKVQAEADQRRSTADLLVNLARRNQSLLNRQLTLIAELEQRERDAEALSDLFQLDHLATRIRRNAESLLVLSGDDPPRLWGRPMPLSEVVRAAAAEVEDYDRVDVLVNDHIEVAGRAVADLAHLVAELIENACTFSPPGTAIRVRSHLAPSEWSTFMMSIEDTGIGMAPADMDAANAVLAEPKDLDLRRSTLGFHVVSRLARRYGLEVRLVPTPGGGVTALVTLPTDMATESRTPLPSAQPYAPAEEPVPAGVGAGAATESAGSLPAGAVGSFTELDDTGLWIDPVTPQIEAPPPATPLRALTSGAVRPPVPPGEARQLAPIAPPENPLLAPIPALAGPPPAPTVDADTPMARVTLPSRATPTAGSPVVSGRIGPPTPSTGSPQLVPGAVPPAPPAAPDKPPRPIWPSSLTAPPTIAPVEPDEDAAATAPPTDRGVLPEPDGDAVEIVSTLDIAEPPPAPPATTPDGLVRRVPGASIAKALRRSETGAPGGEAEGGHDDSPAEATGPLDREAVRSMLSQFQSSQRAGRAVAESPIDLTPPGEDDE